MGWMMHRRNGEDATTLMIDCMANDPNVSAATKLESSNMSD